MELNNILQITFILFHLRPFHSAETKTTNVTIHGSCNFAKPKFPFRNIMTVSTITPDNSEDRNVLVCNVWYNSSDRVLRLYLQKTSYRNRTFLVSTVLDKYGALVLPGYVAEAEQDVSYPFHICPRVHESSSRNYTIFLSAPPNIGINLTVQVDESMLREGQMKPIELGHKVASRLLVFNISSVQSIYDHFLVTVRSDDRDEECLLVVSNDCSDVVNLDPQAIHVEESGSVLRLSFTTFGRVTLSHASSPQLKTGRWFIGVFLKNPKRSRDRTTMKTVEISVDFAAGMRRMPVTYLALVSIFGGFAIAVFAHIFLNPDFESGVVVRFHRYVHKHVFHSTGHGDRVDVQHETNEELVLATATGTNELTRHGSVSLSRLSLEDNGGADKMEVTPSYHLPRCKVPTQWPGFRNWCKVPFHWFRDDENTFAYTTAIVAFSLLTGAAQFIISNWSTMIESGNRDMCYYNEGCYRATTTIDIPYNLMISNLSYVVHSIIFALSVSLREATSRVNASVAIQRRSYAIPYAFSWALFFEGVFSSFYHLCPSRMTFQFDSAFMFVICALIVVAMFNSRTEAARRAALESLEARSDSYRVVAIAPISDTKLFLFFVVPLLSLNYLGSIRDTDGFLMLFPNWVFYWLVILWIMSMFVWAFYRLMIPWTPTRKLIFRCKFVWLCVVFPLVLLFIGFYTVDVKKDWSQFFLFTCLASVVCTVSGVCLTKCLQNIYEHTKVPARTTDESPPREPQWRTYLAWPLVNLPVVIHVVGLAACWTMALHFFLREPVTQKANLPSRSREFNKECVLWEYFDYHDLWHILSSFALLQTAYLLLWSIG